MIKPKKVSNEVLVDLVLHSIDHLSERTKDRSNIEVAKMVLNYLDREHENLVFRLDKIQKIVNVSWY